jgi:hypothetical protein
MADQKSDPSLFFHFLYPFIPQFDIHLLGSNEAFSLFNKAVLLKTFYPNNSIYVYKNYLGGDNETNKDCLELLSNLHLQVVG